MGAGVLCWLNVHRQHNPGLKSPKLNGCFGEKKWEEKDINRH